MNKVPSVIEEFSSVVMDIQDEMPAGEPLVKPRQP